MRLQAACECGSPVKAVPILSTLPGRATVWAWADSTGHRHGPGRYLLGRVPSGLHRAAVLTRLAIARDRVAWALRAGWRAAEVQHRVGMERRALGEAELRVWARRYSVHPAYVPFVLWAYQVAAGMR